LKIEIEKENNLLIMLETPKVKGDLYE